MSLQREALGTGSKGRTAAVGFESEKLKIPQMCAYLSFLLLLVLPGARVKCLINCNHSATESDQANPFRFSVILKKTI